MCDPAGLGWLLTAAPRGSVWALVSLGIHCSRGDDRAPSCQELCLAPGAVQKCLWLPCSVLGSVRCPDQHSSRVALQSPGAVMSVKLWLCLFSAIAAAFGEKRLERGRRVGVCVG